MKPIICLICFGLLLGAAPASQPAAPIFLARSDYFNALSHFEEAYVAHRPQGISRETIHRAFDEIGVLAANSNFGQAIQRLNELTDQLDPATAHPEIRALIRSLQVRISPVIAWRNRPGLLRVRLTRIYPVQMSGPMDLKLVIRADPNKPEEVIDIPAKIESEGPPFQLTRAGPSAPMGRYLIELVGPDNVHYPVGPWTVVELSLDVLRQAQAGRLATLQPDDPEMIHAVIACAARNAIMTDRPDENNPAQFLSNPLEYSRQVQSEVESVVTGKNPYTNRPGEWWRVIQCGAMQVPARIYAPPQVQNHQPMPMVIALQSGASDESAFMYFNGNGKLRQLADQYGFIIVAPNSNWLNNNLAAFGSITQAVGSIYSIDSSRVYVIGHSTGTKAAIKLAAAHADKIAGMALFSGGDFSEVTRLPRTLMFAGGVDPFYPPATARTAALAAQRNHLPVELHMDDQAGHLLLVDDALDEAVKSLLQPPAQN